MKCITISDKKCKNYSVRTASGTYLKVIQGQALHVEDEDARYMLDEVEPRVIEGNEIHMFRFATEEEIAAIADVAPARPSRMTGPSRMSEAPNIEANADSAPEAEEDTPEDTPEAEEDAATTTTNEKTAPAPRRKATKK
jgi:hypothetical protein